MSKNQLSSEQPPLQINTLTSEVTEHQGMKIINRPEGVIMAWETEPDFDISAMAEANNFKDVMLETTQDMMTGETRSVASVKMSHEEYEEFRNQPHVRTMELPAMVPEATSNTLGQLTFMPSASAVRAEYANPPEPAPEDIEKPEAPPGERSSEKLTALKAQREANKSQFIDPDAADEYVRFDDLNQSVDELIGQIKGEPGTLTDYAAQATRGVLGFATDALLGVGELVYEGGKLTVDAAQTLSIAGLQGQALDAQILMEEIRLGNITSDTALSDAGTMASAMGQSIAAPVTEPWNNGQYIEAITRGGAEIASLPLAVLKGNKLSKAAKAADAASDANSASRAAGTAQGTGNAVKSAPAGTATNIAGDTAKATEPAKIADTTSDTTKNADATGDAAKASDATKASEPKGPNDNGSGGKIARNKVNDGALYESYWDNLADTPASLTNRETRAWYLSKELDIPTQLDTTKPIEHQARQAFEIRNDLRSKARDLMADQKLANDLRINEPNLTFDELVEIKSIKNSGYDVWNSIINSSQKSRQSVNEQFNFIGDRPRYD